MLEVFDPYSLWVWSQTTKWNLRISVSPRCFFLQETLLWFDRLSESGMLRITCSKNHFDSFKKFSQFLIRYVINMSRYGSKGYTSVVLGNSEVTLLEERKDAALCPSLYCFLVIYGVAVSEQQVIEFFVFHTSGDISSRPAAFLFLIFVSTKSNTSWVNCQVDFL